MDKPTHRCTQQCTHTGAHNSVHGQPTQVCTTYMDNPHTGAHNKVHTHTFQQTVLKAKEGSGMLNQPADYHKEEEKTTQAVKITPHIN